ncbi:NAD(P)H-hydrate dehydratase [Yoonia litorea]|uniref:Bifunctional NAD(P)H-hydrate repair enzyme n=1 Tax=Yoonia litorea TaxID=1123755 RepID=A0A1I6LW84_9RHOB|nr:NAD(P)H-hydrate dehydratase [Yoonia litorea]SFS07727.1 yjeF C-terminal region, hydroxyethylthiazole kinase-related/yjeF N-terminal region [Yoonia litorea]
MTELLTSAQMRAIEADAIATGHVSGLEMMEAAGSGVVAAILAWRDGRDGPLSLHGKLPRFFGQTVETGASAVVLCGPGNNGGDGFVIGRLLHRAGWAVEVFLLGDPEALRGDARTNYEHWLEIGDVRPLSDCTSDRWIKQTLVVDALFGTGLTRHLPDVVENVLMATANCPRVAVDVPSGLCADRGVVLSERSLPAAHLTVTFHRPKLGHLLADGPTQCGALAVADIGLAARGIAPFKHDQVVSEAVPSDLRKQQGHKYSHGHALVLSGGVGRGGAARLAARAALRVGAGAVTIGCPPAAMIENAAQLNAIMLQAVGDVGALDAILDDSRINALCVGPGFGLSEDRADKLHALLKSGRAAVIDADALTLLSKDADLRGALHGKCVLTPHAGEFARLFPDLADAMDSTPDRNKTEIVRMAAADVGCVVVFKGADTVIADPTGTCCVNASAYHRAAPWLATAGSGDVLAGLIAGLMARGVTPWDAAQTGAWLHTESAVSFGPGLIAEDLPEELPNVLQNIAS